MNGKANATKSSNRDASKPAQGSNRRRNRGNGEAADWGSASPQKVMEAIQAVTKNGFAIRFGYTRDGGAYSIGIVGDGDPFTEYVRPTEDIDLYLEGLTLDYQDGSRPAWDNTIKP